ETESKDHLTATRCRRAIGRRAERRALQSSRFPQPERLRLGLRHHRRSRGPVHRRHTGLGQEPTATVESCRRAVLGRQSPRRATTNAAPGPAPPCPASSSSPDRPNATAAASCHAASYQATQPPGRTVGGQGQYLRCPWADSTGLVASFATRYL